MKSDLKVLDNGTVQFSHFQRHQNPWDYVAEEIRLDVDERQQGSHVDYDVAVLNIRRHDGEYIEAIIGTERIVDDMIKALELVKKKLQVKRLRQDIKSNERQVAQLELEINGQMNGS